MECRRNAPRAEITHETARLEVHNGTARHGTALLDSVRHITGQYSTGYLRRERRCLEMDCTVSVGAVGKSTAQRPSQVKVPLFPEQTRLKLSGTEIR